MTDFNPLQAREDWHDDTATVDPARAHARLVAFVSWFGDGYIDGDEDDLDDDDGYLPLHSRDLAALLAHYEHLTAQETRP